MLKEIKEPVNRKFTDRELLEALFKNEEGKLETKIKNVQNKTIGDRFGVCIETISRRLNSLQKRGIIKMKYIYKKATSGCRRDINLLDSGYLE